MSITGGLDQVVAGRQNSRLPAGGVGMAGDADRVAGDTTSRLGDETAQAAAIGRMRGSVR